jgi:hypothetical protein
MTRREAKRDACHSAALILQNSLDVGWQTERKYPDPAEEKRFLAAMAELIEELFRRGKK